MRYSGVLASASKWRRHIGPREGDDKTTAPRRPTVVSRTLAGVPIDKPQAPKPARDATRGCVNAATNYIDWHTLLERVYDIDSLQCPRFGAGLRFIAVLTGPEPIRAILDSMGLPSTPPVPARARYPTVFEDSQPAGCIGHGSRLTHAGSRQAGAAGFR